VGSIVLHFLLFISFSRSLIGLLWSITSACKFDLFIVDLFFESRQQRICSNRNAFSDISFGQIVGQPFGQVGQIILLWKTRQGNVERDFNAFWRLRFRRKRRNLRRKKCSTGKGLFWHFYVQIFCTNVVSAAFTMYMQLEKAAETTFVQKICTFNVDEIDTR